MAVYAGPDIVEDGLVLCLDAANLKSYPGSGVTWRDLSGNDNHFSMVGTLSFASGAFTSTASTSNYFIRNPFNHPTTAVTAEMWCLPNIGSFNDGLWSYASSATDNNQLLFNQSNLTIYGPVNDSGEISNINIVDGKWKQIILTSNRSTGSAILYVDGEPKFTTTKYAGTNFTSGGSMVLGQDQDSVGGGLDANQAFEGKYSIFRIYNRVLSPSEILQNFNALRGRYNL